MQLAQETMTRKGITQGVDMIGDGNRRVAPLFHLPETTEKNGDYIYLSQNPHEYTNSAGIGIQRHHLLRVARSMIETRKARETGDFFNGLMKWVI